MFKNSGLVYQYNYYEDKFIKTTFIFLISIKYKKVLFWKSNSMKSVELYKNVYIMDQYYLLLV